MAQRNEDGEREVLGCELGVGETGALWTGFLRSLVSRGLIGVQLVTSDAHLGLREAIRSTLLGATCAAGSMPCATVVLGREQRLGRIRETVRRCSATSPS